MKGEQAAVHGGGSLGLLLLAQRQAEKSGVKFVPPDKEQSA